MKDPLFVGIAGQRIPVIVYRLGREHYMIQRAIAQHLPGDPVLLQGGLQDGPEPLPQRMQALIRPRLT